MSSLGRLTERRTLVVDLERPERGEAELQHADLARERDHDDRQHGDQDPLDDEGGAHHPDTPVSPAPEPSPEGLGVSSGRSWEGENELGAVHSGSPFASRNCITGVPSAVSP